ncbi:MAG: hypothetical protein WCK59_03555 [Candidatus Falkowbacteria bacterium]
MKTRNANDWRFKLEEALSKYARRNNDKYLKLWEDACSEALREAEASNFNFDELLLWKHYIPAKYQEAFEVFLKKQARDEYQRLLVAVILKTGCPESEIRQNLKSASLGSLDKIIKKLLGNTGSTWRNEKMKIIINERPDILFNFEPSFFGSLLNCLQGSSYFDNEKMPLLLDYFKKSKELKAFSQKIHFNSGFQDEFNKNEKVLETWNALSESEFNQVEGFQAEGFFKRAKIYFDASPSWQKDLNNFKLLTTAILGNDEVLKKNFLIVAAQNFGEESFHYHAIIMTLQKIIKKKISAKGSFDELFEQANKGSFDELFEQAKMLDVKISKTQKTIIKAFLKM